MFQRWKYLNWLFTIFVLKIARIESCLVFPWNIGSFLKNTTSIQTIPTLSMMASNIYKWFVIEFWIWEGERVLPKHRHMSIVLRCSNIYFDTAVAKLHCWTPSDILTNVWRCSGVWGPWTNWCSISAFYSGHYLSADILQALWVLIQWFEGYSVVIYLEYYGL